MRIVFTKHAEEKFEILKKYKFPVTREEVLDTIQEAKHIDRSRSPLMIFQRTIDTYHVLRVVCRREGGALIVITFYPGRVSQYGTE